MITLERGFKGSAARENKLDAFQKCMSLLANNILYVLSNCFWMLSLLRLMSCTTATLNIISTVSSDYKTTSVTASGSPESFKAKLCDSLSE